MAGYREFQTGEVLTAANVNDFLGKQSVMKFADAAARNTALGTAVGGANALREGMVAYLDDTDELLKFDGTAWASIGAAGIGSNVVQVVKDTEFSTTSSTFVDVTGLSATITPSSATSKVLVIAHITHTAVVPSPSQGSMLIRLNGGGSDVYVGAGTGAAAMSWNLNVTGASFFSGGNNFASTVVYLISPATTSPVTIDTQVRVYFSTAKICPDNGLYGQTPSSLTLIEVAP